MAESSAYDLKTHYTKMDVEMRSSLEMETLSKRFHGQLAFSEFEELVLKRS